MSRQRKRKREELDDKVVEENSDPEGLLTKFLNWCGTEEFGLNSKVIVGWNGTCSGLGMTAKRRVRAGESLFVAPRRSLLSPATGRLSTALRSAGLAVGDEEEGTQDSESDASSSSSSQANSGSGWAPLLLTLVAEYSAEASPWKAYLRLMADSPDLDLPLLWPKEERERLLAGTQVVNMVERDLERIREEFENVSLPFIERHSSLFGREANSLRLYQRMAAFVMSCSFTDTRPPHSVVMVPMADVLNHHYEHDAELIFEASQLSMVARHDIAAGAEIFNTYGKVDNTRLLHQYGFTEQDNPHDVAMVPCSIVLKAATKLFQTTKQQLKERWRLLTDYGIVNDDPSEVFEVDRSGAPDDQFLFITELLCMSQEEFDAWQQKAELGEMSSEADSSDGEGDEEDHAGREEKAGVSVKNMPVSITKDQASLLSEIAQTCLSGFCWTPEVCQRLVGRQNGKALPRRELHALRVCSSQQTCLQALLDRCIACLSLTNRRMKK